MNSNPIQFERKGRRKRKHTMMSAELILIVKRLADQEDESESTIVERAVWSDLVDRYGRERVLELVDDVQGEIKPEDQLVNSVQVEITP